jgi:hypothetical protein
MRLIFLLLGSLYLQVCFSQTEKVIQPSANIRLSFLLFPFTPLLTVEVRTIENLTHGANLKYFIKKRMEADYLFTRIALVENKLLRKDNKTTFLPYAGYGYAYRFGKKNKWTFDNRIGIGASTNADKNAFYPVIKTGIGRIF